MKFMNSLAWKVTYVGGFALVVFSLIGYMLYNAGVQLPLAPSRDYKVSFVSKDADNLVTNADVMVAGVKIGKVEEIENAPKGATIHLALYQDKVQLHRGATVRVGAKSLVGESYINIKDGSGPSIPSGTRLPATAVKENVQLREVLASLGPQTRESLGRLARTLGDATQGRKRDLSDTMRGLGYLGREGYTAVDAIAAQSEDLTALVRQTSTVLRALNTGEGQIGTLVRNAQRITSATSGQGDSIQDTMRRLPAVLGSARTATSKLKELAGALQPVAADLNASAPHLSKALKQLPATSADLRGLLPSLDNVLDDAPATLKRIPAASEDVRELVPQLRETMSHLNPMLGYLEPYGQDLAAFAVNFSALLRYTDEVGIHYARLQPIMGNEHVVKGVPLKLPTAVLSYKSPYPEPGQSANPGPGGKFEKLHPQPK